MINQASHDEIEKYVQSKSKTNKTRRGTVSTVEGNESLFGAGRGVGPADVVVLVLRTQRLQVLV